MSGGAIIAIIIIIIVIIIIIGVAWYLISSQSGQCSILKPCPVGQRCVGGKCVSAGEVARAESAIGRLSELLGPQTQPTGPTQQPLAPVVVPGPSTEQSLAPPTLPTGPTLPTLPTVPGLSTGGNRVLSGIRKIMGKPVGQAY